MAGAALLPLHPAGGPQLPHPLHRDPGQIPNHALTLTFIVSWRRRSSTKQELGVRAAGENLIRKMF